MSKLVVGPLRVRVATLERQLAEAQRKLKEMVGLYIKHDARSHYKGDRVCAACCRDRILRGTKEDE